MNLQKVINSLTLKDEPKYAIDVINSNIDILVNDGGMKKTRSYSSSFRRCEDVIQK
ncbi:TPA: hypothetical protein ACQCWR_001728 [Campylobacter jejuni]